MQIKNAQVFYADEAQCAQWDAETAEHLRQRGVSEPG